MPIFSFANKGRSPRSSLFSERLSDQIHLKGIPISEIQSGRYLSFAIPKDVQDFFARRCLNRSQQCSILYTTEDRVYYTQSKISSLESSVQQFYSVSKRDLDREFPDYKEIDISILELLVQRYLSSLRPAHHFRILQSFPFIPFLKRDGIEINIDWQYQIDDGESIHIPLCLLLPFGKTEVNRLY